MPSEKESLSHPPGEAVRTADTRVARPTRPLGRGLEDVSHLFLSAARETPAHAGVEDLAIEPPAPVRAGVAVLRPGATLIKDQLMATLLECQNALENGMRALEAAVSCGPYGEIDLLALDACNRLTVVDADTTPGDGLLLRGMGHIDWVTRNAAIVRRMCTNWPIDSAQSPRLILVAPRFSPLLRAAVRQTGPQVACYRYLPVAIFGRTAILVERLRDDDDEA
jgi:hypothetical protein